LFFSTFDETVYLNKKTQKRVSFYEKCHKSASFFKKKHQLKCAKSPKQCASRKMQKKD